MKVIKYIHKPAKVIYIKNIKDAHSEKGEDAWKRNSTFSTERSYGRRRKKGTLIGKGRSFSSRNTIGGRYKFA